MISEVLGGRALKELDAIVLGNGPGSFIGMRIGASVAQGIAYAAGFQIIPVSSLAAIAAEVLSDAKEDCVVVVQDARMAEVYLGQFRRGEDGSVAHMTEETLHEVGLLPLTPDGWLAAGGGWERYPELLAANRSRISAGDRNTISPGELPAGAGECRQCGSAGTAGARISKVESGGKACESPVTILKRGRSARHWRRYTTYSW